VAFKVGFSLSVRGLCGAAQGGAIVLWVKTMQRRKAEIKPQQ